MIFFVWALAFCLFISSVLLDSFSDSLDRTLDRLGADIIVVPQEFAREAADSLFLGELNSFSFDRKWLEPLSQIEGIEALTPQTYLTSLDATCCSVPTQMIVIDPETDFIIKPWLEAEGLPLPTRGQLYIGQQIIRPQTQKLSFFGEDYEIIGQLERTNTSFDTCVFMTTETAQDVMDSDLYLDAFGKPEHAAKDLVSSVMIKAEEGTDSKAIARRINFLLEDAPIRAYATLDMFADFSNSVQSLGNYSDLLLGILVVLVIIALLSVFSITVNERTHEFGVLSILGVAKSRLSLLIMLEGLLLGLVGSVLGVLSAGLGLYIFKIPLMLALNIPRLNASPGYYLCLGLRCLLFALAISLLASLYSALRIGKTSSVNLLRGGEM